MATGNQPTDGRRGAPLSPPNAPTGATAPVPNLAALPTSPGVSTPAADSLRQPTGESQEANVRTHDTWVMSPSGQVRTEQGASVLGQPPISIFGPDERFGSMQDDGGELALPQQQLVPYRSEAVQLTHGLVCDVCGQLAAELWSCSSCGLQGHRDCLGMSFVAGYAFCNGCGPQAQFGL